jgi:hypothetical protein
MGIIYPATSWQSLGYWDVSGVYHGASSRKVKRAEQEEMHEDYKKFKTMLSQVPGPAITLVNKVDTETSSPVDFEFINELKLGEGVPKRTPSSRLDAAVPSPAAT